MKDGSLAGQAAPARRVPAWRQRGNDRRRLLLEVTIELIGREGVDAVTHRRVAELAGVPLGSTTYYFSSRQDLLIRTFEHFLRQEVAAMRERLAPIGSGRRSVGWLVDQLVAFFEPDFGEERWRTVALYALFNEAARWPELTPALHEYNRGWFETLEEVFGQLGAEDPVLETRMLTAMLDGFFLFQLSTPRPDFMEAVFRPALERCFSRAARSREG